MTHYILPRREIRPTQHKPSVEIIMSAFDRGMEAYCETRVEGPFLVDDKEGARYFPSDRCRSVLMAD